jgi:ABC-type transport system involved in multi-copper enzyme maturation permease subunit
MTTIVQTRPDRQITTPTGRNSPLLSVLAWELRRFRASRLFWFQALGIFCFLLFLTWALHASQGFGTESNNLQLFGSIAGTSPEGLLHTLPTVLLVLALFLPFVTADGVARDFSRRTHELLLTTAVPTWAYVWGRYLASLLISLGLALLVLASLLGVGWLLHLTTNDYPAPDLPVVLLLWASMVVSATILVSSLGFALSTLFPRLSMLIKVVSLVAWIFGGVVIPLGQGNATPPAWAINWDPTSGMTAHGLLAAYPNPMSFAITSEAQLQQIISGIESKIPTLAGWFAPHLGLSGLGLALVLVAALAFKRSRDVLN